MPCEFQPLYDNDYGYVVRCKDCGFFQIGFISTMLTLSALDFSVFIQLVEHKYNEDHIARSLNEKNTVIETPSPGYCMILNNKETGQLLHLLEKADNEARALDMIKLFN